MFETLVTGILTNVLGSYIDPKCFSSDKINVAVWSGYVVLRSLELKPEIINHPALQLVRGVCGSIELKIPWNRLHSDSAVITIDDVYLLVRTEEDIERVMMEQDPFTLKKQLVEQLYAQAKHQREEENQSSQTKSEKEGFAARLVNKIIDNLELHIRRIHVRLEDYSSGDHPFAAGLTIESVHAQSTNSNWQPSYVDTSKSNEPRIYKIIELNHLSLYLNPHCEVLRNQQVDFETCSLNEFMNAFNHSIPKRFDERYFHHHHPQMYPSHQQHHFILKPVDASARLIINRDPFETSVPKLELDVSVEEVAFRLEESQYCDVLYLAATFQIPEHFCKYQQYRKYRPKLAFGESTPKEWWRYAINAVLDDVQTKRMQWSWAYMKERREDRKKYVTMWQKKAAIQELGQRNQYLLSDSEMEEGEEDDEQNESSDDERSVRSSKSGVSLKPVRANETRILEEIERRRSVEDILLFRYIADLKRELNPEKLAPQRRTVPMPPLSSNSAISETESVDSEVTESSLPTEMKYRTWGNWLFGWSSMIGATSSSDGTDSLPKRAIPEVELRELFKILEYEPTKRSKRKPQATKARDSDSDDALNLEHLEDSIEPHVVSRVTFTLTKGSFTLTSDPDANKKLQRDDPDYGHKYSPSDFLLCTFTQLQVAAISKGESLKVDASLQSIEAFDESAEGSAFSRLISRKDDFLTTGADKGSKNAPRLSGAVFLMSYETNPAHSMADAALYVHMEPLEIALSPTARCWGRLAGFLNTPQVLGLWAELEVASFNDIVNLKARTEAKLKYVMANRIALSVDFRVQAPVIIIPESDTDFNCARLVVDLGHINFRTDRLSKLDADTSVLSNPNSNTSNMSSSLVVLRHNSSPDLSSSTSFVKQLYDEAEKGEGAIRWKEEFYDKFSLSVTNVHVLLIPYGRKRHPQTVPLGPEPHTAASLPPHLRELYEQEKEFELIERFNINVIVRTSVLPLDATLTRLYVHADLPALTVNLSLEKYHQLMYLADRFSIKAQDTNDDSSLFASSDGLLPFPISPLEEETRFLAGRRNSFLETTAFDAFALDGTMQDDAQSDGESSVDSDDTWFSIASGNNAEATNAEGSEDSTVSFARTASEPMMVSTPEKPIEVPMEKKKPKRRRYGPSTKSAELLDRKLFICTLTFPLISIHLKKPRTSAPPVSASYRYEAAELDEDLADNGTILIKLEGFRLRLAKRTLSTQVNLCVRSLDVEDYLDASGRSTEYLVFSCPSIAAPYSMRAPARRGVKYGTVKRRSSRQRERVISFQKIPVSRSSSGSLRPEPAPDQLLEVLYSSRNDSKTGEEVSRDLDLAFGSIQVNFDQSYVCSLLEVMEDAKSKLALMPIPTDDSTVQDALFTDDLPPLELSPSLNPEYFPSMSLTESVRLDLERARKNFLEQSGFEIDHVATANDQKQPVAMNIQVRFYSLSACFCDRGEVLASVAVLRTQVSIGNDQENQLVVTAAIEDIKLFDLAPPAAAEATDTTKLVGRPTETTRNYREVFGLDNALVERDAELVNQIVVVDATICRSTTEPEDAQPLSRIHMSLQPVRFVVLADFVERVSSYALAGPLAIYLLQLDQEELGGRISDYSSRDRTESFSLDNYSRRRAWTNPPDDASSTPRRDSSTPFFDAIDPTNHSVKDRFNSPMVHSQSSYRTDDPDLALCMQSPEPRVSQSATAPVHQLLDKPQPEAEATTTKKSFFDTCIVELRLVEPTIVLLRTSLAVETGICINLGVISVTTQTRMFGSEPQAWHGRELALEVHGLNIACRRNESFLLEKTDASMSVVIPTVDVARDWSTNPSVGDVRASFGMKELEEPKLHLSVVVSPVCVNVSEIHACSMLEVLETTINPIVKTMEQRTHHLKTKEPSSSLSNAVKRKVDLSATVSIDEIKAVFWIGSHAFSQFESGLRALSESHENGHPQFDGLFASNARSSSPRKQRPHLQSADHGADSVKIPLRAVAEVALRNLMATCNVDHSASHEYGQVPCDIVFKIQEIVLQDKAAEESDTLTKVLCPVPLPRARTNGSNGIAVTDRPWEEQRHSLPLAGLLSPRSTGVGSGKHSMSLTSTDDVYLSESRMSANAHHSAAIPQLSIKLRREYQIQEDQTATALHTCDVCLASLQLVLLPRSLLRIEHFVLTMLLAVQKKLQHLQVTRAASKLPNATPIGNPSHLDAADEINEIRGEGSLYRTGMLLNSKRDSLTDSMVLDDSIAGRIKVPDASPARFPHSQRSVPNSHGSRLATSVEANENEESVVESRRRFEFHAEMFNLQLWLTPSDKKKDSTGLMLSSNIKIGFKFEDMDATINHHAHDQLEFLNAIAEIRDIELGINSYEANGPSENDAKGGRHHAWTLVESFDVDLSLTGTKQVGHQEEEDQADNDQTDQLVAIDDQLAEASMAFKTSINVEKIFCRVSYRDFPLILRIGQDLSRVVVMDVHVRQAFQRHLSASTEDTEWRFTSSNQSEISVFHETDDETDASASDLEETHPVVVWSVGFETHLTGLQFRLINNIVGEESPVVGIRIGPCEAHGHATHDGTVDVSSKASMEAWYHNLRLVTSEPLLEPWNVQLAVSIVPPRKRLQDSMTLTPQPPVISATVSASEVLQLNITDAFIANLVAAKRAWKWVVNEGGDPRGMAEYSTYWIRNNTGLRLRYWGPSCRMSFLDPGAEEPLEFLENGAVHALVRRHRSHSLVGPLHERQLFIAVEEHNSSAARARKWQSEGAIPVDQVDSRLYGLVDFDVDATSMKMRKCECVIDVLVEKGCKVFVVRSTLLLENKTSSDLEVEFIQPHRRSGSPPSRSVGLLGHVTPCWKTVVKAASIVPVPLHLVSASDGHLMVRPPDIKPSMEGMLPKAYAKERVKINLFDKSIGSQEAIEAVEDQSAVEEGSIIKFHRLFSDRPVRPFIMNVHLHNTSNALYCRKLSFYPPLVIHNLTAGPLEFCLSTPNDWIAPMEAADVGSSTSRGWEDCPQRLRERGTINVADSLVWHLSDADTPLELRLRMQGFEWSEPFRFHHETQELDRIRMKDLASDACLWISAKTKLGEGNCREVFLYVPYWIVNLTGLKLEYEYDEERTGHEHSVMLLAGQKRLDREQLLLQEESQSKKPIHQRHPQVVYPLFREEAAVVDPEQDDDRPNTQTSHSSSDSKSTEADKRRRHPCLLPSVPPIKGILDLLPKTVEDARSMGQLEVLQACHSSYRHERGCIRLRVNNESDTMLPNLDSSRDGLHSKWSEGFVLDQTGTTGEIEAEDHNSNRIYSIGYSIHNAEGQYSRTKVVMLTPRVVLVNALSCAIEICHSSAKTMFPVAGSLDQTSGAMAMESTSIMPSVNPVAHLDAGAYVDFHWSLRFAKSRTIRCRLAEYGWTWSGAVPLTESGEYAIRMRHESTRENKLVRVTLKVDSSCICVYFREESANAPPYRIENYSLETLRVHQQHVRRSEILLPHHSLEYAWDEPTQERLLVVDMLPSAAGDNSRPLRIGTFSLDKIQRHPDAVNGTLGIEVSTDGPTRVLRFTDTRLRSGKDLVNNHPMTTDVVASSDQDAVFARFLSSPSFRLAVQLRGIGLSVVDALPKELLYVSLSNISLEALISQESSDNIGYSGDREAAVSRLERETSARTLACRLQIGDLQIDNQLQLTPFPVLLRFSQRNQRPVNAQGEVVNVPVLTLCLVKHDEYAGIDFIRHLSAKVLPMHIRIDGSLLSHLAPLLVHGNEYGGREKPTAETGALPPSTRTNSDLVQDFNASLEISASILESSRDGQSTSLSRSRVSQDQSASSRSHKVRSSAAAIGGDRYVAYNRGRIPTKDVEKKLYFEEFQIDTIQATVSFSFGASAGAMVEGHYASVVNSYTYSLSGTGARGNHPVITVGPLRLILNAIGTSLTKIANAPFKLKPLEINHSFVQPDALAARLLSHYQSEALRQAYVILGSVDVLGNPMIAWKNLKGGFQDFVYEPVHGLQQMSPTAFAFGMGRGTASLVRASVYTFLDFNTRILTAFSLGLSEACLKLDEYTGYPATRNIYQGLAQGVSGIVVAPMHSFEMNGARGLAPGVLAGLLGLVLKPLLGFSLATSTMAATLRDAIDPNTKALLMRVRPPRYIDLRTKKLKVYSYVESLGEEIVGKLRGGRYRGDGYLGHVDLKQKCLLVTRKRILFVDVKANQKYDVEWELLADEMVLVECKSNPNATDGLQNFVIFYYMGDEFNPSRRRTTMSSPFGPLGLGMRLMKHVVPLPESKNLFLRAMIQQQERSVLTKMNASAFVSDLRPTAAPGGPYTPTPTPSKPMGTPNPDFAPWNPRVGWQYPIFRITGSSLPAARSFKELAQATKAQDTSAVN